MPLPIGVNGGWYKLLNGEIVEFPDLKPITDDIPKRVSGLEAQSADILFALVSKDIL